MKFAVSIFTILLAVVGTLVFMQYQVYSDQTEEMKDGFVYSQEIEVEYRENSLDVRHHFKNLPEGEIKIDWPATAVDVECFLENENSCKRLNDSKTKFIAGENGSQSVSYVIPLKDGLQSGQLQKDVFTLLEKGKVRFTTIHITTPTDITGSFVTGLPLIGYQQLALVNYSMFSGAGDIQDLYWQKYNFNFLITRDEYSLYSNSSVTAAEQAELKALKTISDDHISIVKVQNTPKQQGHRIVFVDTTNSNTIYRELTLQQLEQMYTFVKTPSWLKQVVASVLVKEDIGFAKSKEVLTVLRSELDEEQLVQFTDKLQALEGSELSPTILDETLSEVLGVYTKYLSLNVDAETVYPFVYNDKRAIFVNGKQKKQLHILLKDNTVYYPAEELLKSLGYKTTEGANGYYVNAPNRSYRFPANEHLFYVFNERRFNISTTPFIEIGNVRYIEEAFAGRVFNFDIDKNEETIELTTTNEQ